MRAGDYAKAAEKLEEALKLAPGSVGVLYQLGLAYYNVDRFDDTIRVWTEAAGKLPDGDMMKTTLLDIIKRGGERKMRYERKKRLEGLLREDPALLEEGLELAGIYEKERQRGMAKELYVALMRSHPRDARACVGYASMAYHEGRILHAEVYYGLAFDINPGDDAVKKMVMQIKEEIDALRVSGFEKFVKEAH